MGDKGWIPLQRSQALLFTICLSIMRDASFAHVPSKVLESNATFLIQILERTKSLPQFWCLIASICKIRPQMVAQRILLCNM